MLPYFAATAALALIWLWAAERPRLQFAVEVGLHSLAGAGGRRRVSHRLGHVPLLIRQGLLRQYQPSRARALRWNPRRSAHNAEGHPGYLLGKPTQTGFWYFYLVDLAVKTPLALLVLFFIGAVATLRRHSADVPVLLRRPWMPLAFSAGVLGVAMFSHINIGIRHVMPIYAGMCITAAFGLVRLLVSAPLRQWAGWTALLLAVWYGGSSLAAHPDYLAYFNELAGSHPENIVVDSDLDWGQDMKRLAAKLHEVGATEVYLLPMSLGDLEKEYGFPDVDQSHRRAKPLARLECSESDRAQAAAFGIA